MAVPKGQTWMVAAGGVQINPWAVIEKAQTSETIAAVRTPAKRTNWWWDLTGRRNLVGALVGWVKTA